MKPIFIKNFLPEQILNLCRSYLYIKLNNKTTFTVDPSTDSLVVDYADYLMETIMDMSTPVIEQNVGKKLWPTYSFLRVYGKGSDLKPHTDRDSCEYTVALCLGSDPEDKPYDIFLGEQDSSSDYKHIDVDTKKLTAYKIENKYAMKLNDALIFQGQDKEHWRETCTHDHFITVFLHYVDQEGDLADYKFDKRKFLGQPEK
tara:strand:- start:2163 stop:2765 length:603 start_codon:yes stop_codon:yes gene_type:complete